MRAHPLSRHTYQAPPPTLHRDGDEWVITWPDHEFLGAKVPGHEARIPADLCEVSQDGEAWELRYHAPTGTTHTITRHP